VRYVIPAALAALVAALGACDNPNDFLLDPAIVTDTVTLVAPSVGSDLPSALDITAVGSPRHGARFPEQLGDAGQWDLALRLRDGQLVFLPAGAVGSAGTNAALTHPITGKTFSQLIEAPGRSAFVKDSAVVLSTGAPYAARSRLIPCGITNGELFAKFQVLEAVPAEGRVKIEVIANLNCSDPRLAESG
jgi:hypothetical protein